MSHLGARGTGGRWSLPTGRPAWSAYDLADQTSLEGTGAQIGRWMWGGGYRCLSGGALRHRHAEPGHPVEHRASGPGFGLLGGQSPGAEATTDDGLVPEHGGLPERAPALTHRLLPAHAS